MHSIRFLGRFINASTVVGSDAQTRPGYNFHLGFTYAPTIVKWDGVYHLFCCSADYSGTGWDQIRHATSADGVSWSEPRIALFTSDSVGEHECRLIPRRLVQVGHHHTHEGVGAGLVRRNRGRRRRVTGWLVEIAYAVSGRAGTTAHQQREAKRYEG